MKRRKRWPNDLIPLAFVVLAVRLAWMLANSPIGWRAHLERWAAFTLSDFGIETSRLNDRAPDLQAKFWLDEVSRIKLANEDSQVAMGAAWILDLPQYGFRNHHLRVTEQFNFPGIAVRFGGLDFDSEAIETLAAKFESLCHMECVSRIETATRLESDNVDLWRARAILLFSPERYSSDSKPRSVDWLSVLDECMAHDGDNALYDYLAALHLWSASAKIEFDTGRLVIRTHDAAKFDQGKARFTAGQAKPYLKFVNNDYSSAMAFLNVSSIDRLDQLAAVESRQIAGTAGNLLFPMMKLRV